MPYTPNGGDCFVANGNEFLTLSDDHILVQGIVKNSIDGLPMTHCWIERIIVGNPGTKAEFKYEVCIDKSNGNDVELPKQLYYMLGNIKEENVRRYTKDEYQSKLLETNNWGPWDLDCDR